jgi:hypothetical protein
MNKKVIKLFSSLSLSIMICVSSVGTTFASASNYLDVIDTVIGVSTYYTLNQKLDLDKAKLILVDPNRKFTTLENLRYAGNIDKKFLNSIGKYTLALGYKINDKYKVVESDTFTVEDPSTVILSSDDFGMGGDDDRFDFPGAPEEVVPLDPFSLTITALNASGQVDTNYKGTITFESDDVDAQLPEDYKFVAGDAGKRTFTNAFYLAELGTQTITVKDKTTSTLIGELEIDVAVANKAAEGNLVVESPTPGTITVNTINFIGTADPGLAVKIFDQGVFLTEGNAGADGKFNIATASLPDGEYVFTLETSTAKSNAIKVVVSTKGSSVSSVLINPTSPVAGANTEITVTFKEAVNSVSALISGKRNLLTATDASKKVYKGQFVAPTEPSEYPVNLDITNALGVKAEIEAAAKFTVVVDDGSTAGGLFDSISFNVPSRVTNLVAIPEDKQVVLNWKPSTAAAGMDYYKIYYGTSPGNLDMSVDTNDSSPAWFVADLENEVRYYFSVYGVDMEGNESDQGSEIVSAIPGVEGSAGLLGSADGQIEVDATAETGPGLILVFLIGSFLIYSLRKFRLV